MWRDARYRQDLHEKERRPEQHEPAESQDLPVAPWTKRPEAAVWTMEASWEILQDVISVAA